MNAPRPAVGTTLQGRTWDGCQWRALGGICVSPPIEGLVPAPMMTPAELEAQLEASLDATLPRPFLANPESAP